MGKYTKRLKERPLPTLPAENEEDPKYQEKLDAEKSEILQELGGKAVPELLAETLLAARAVRDEKKAIAKKANLRYDALKQMLCSSFGERGMSAIKLVSGKTISNEPEVVTKVDDKLKFHEWSIQNGHLPEMQLPWQTRNRIAKDLFLGGGKDPDGVTLGLRDKIVVR